MQLKINIDIDKKYKGTSITIQAHEWSEDLEEIMKFLKKGKTQRLLGIDEDQTIVLNPNDIEYIYAEQRRVYAALKNRDIELKMKLYEVEDLLAPHDFSRFSKSVIGNLNQIERFELSFNGNLCVYFRSGKKEYITKKYVASIKKQLMEGGPKDDNRNS